MSAKYIRGTVLIRHHKSKQVLISSREGRLLLPIDKVKFPEGTKVLVYIVNGEVKGVHKAR